VPRTPMTVRTRPAANSYTPLAVATWDAFDNTNGMYVPVNGRTALIIRNPTAGALTATVTSQPDRSGRTKDIGPTSIPAGGTLVYQEFTQEGWGDPAVSPGNRMYVDASGTGLVYLAIQRAAGA
jgi:hypothetical protein